MHSDCAGLPLRRHRRAVAGSRSAAGHGALPYLPLAVVGAHLSGQPLNHELVALGARLRRATRTAPDYRLYALPDGRRPGLVRRAGQGAPIEVEVWDIPSAAVGALLAVSRHRSASAGWRSKTVSEITGFLCEAHAVEHARDVTEFGGWRAWRAG